MSIRKFPSLYLSMAVIPFVIVCSKAQPVKDIQIQTQDAEQGSSFSQGSSNATIQTSQEIQVNDDFHEYQKAAEKGDPKAQYNLGDCYVRGRGVGTNYYEAATWFRKAAEQGDAKAQCQLGCLFLSGQGVEMNYNEANKWIRKAVEQGNAEAQYELGWIYYLGKGVESNNVEGTTWILKSAEAGYGQAQWYLGVYYSWGKNVEKDYYKSVAWYKKAAEQGHANAQCNLGFAYLNGQGVETNHAESVKWFRKAAEQGYSNAQVWLAKCYLDGKGVARDSNEAEKWLRKAVELGDEFGRRELADMNRKASEAEAAKDIRKLADGGSAYYQLQLGECYDRGAGVEYNSDTAAKWYYKAALQGNAEAQCNLGCYYGANSGIKSDCDGGVERCEKMSDKVEAVKWYRKAANQGYPRGQFGLGNYYEAGDGVIKNLQKAYGWYLLASAGGYKCDVFLRRLEGQLSPSEQRNARNWAESWTPQVMSSDALHSEGGDSSPETSPDWTSTGSGFFISESGYFITANHVVSGAARIVLNTKGGKFGAKLIAADKVNDVAILKVDTKTTGHVSPLTIPPRSKATLGQSVFTVGFPNPSLQGVNPKLTKGEISALTGLQDDIRAYQISIPVQSGNSGGVLADEHANVLGIVVQKLNTLGVALVTGDVPQNVNYALKVSYANSLIDSVPGLADSLPQPSGEALTYEKAVEKVQAASALVLSFGQKEE